MRAGLQHFRHFQWTGKRLALILLLSWLAASCTHNPDRRAESELHPGWPRRERAWREAHLPVLQVAYPEIPEAELLGDNEFCMTCHEGYARHFQERNVHRQQKCEDCHGPASRHMITRGREPGLILSFKSLRPAERSEICLKCHQQDACSVERTWRTSVHAHKGVACTDCHTAHHEVPPGTPATTLENSESRARSREPGVASAGPGDPGDVQHSTFNLQHSTEPSTPDSLRGTSNALGAVAPQVCYRCHQETIQLEQIADPHQVGGPNGFNCTTCHDPHGNIRADSRTDLCVGCHKGSVSKAWHSSIHSLEGVACTDCHNPHPDTHPRSIVHIRHTSIRRPKRLPMSVSEPDACYKCHPETFGKSSLPSHHPIQEGKMVCSDCHDPHGRFDGNLKDVSVNQVCWRCHSETQGPFAYEHPPVTENCLICHEPHGTVENNLLRQPTTFLCLRCHSGHRTGPGFHDFPAGNPRLPDIGNSPALQKAFFTDCTQCHSQVHGSDVPSPHRSGVFAR